MDLINISVSKLRSVGGEMVGSKEEVWDFAPTTEEPDTWMIANTWRPFGKQEVVNLIVQEDPMTHGIRLLIDSEARFWQVKPVERDGDKQNWRFDSKLGGVDHNGLLVVVDERDKAGSDCEFELWRAGRLMETILVTTGWVRPLVEE